MIDHLPDNVVRESTPVERLLEDSWSSRSRQAGRRELLAETAAAALFLAAAVPAAVAALVGGHVDLGVAGLLVAIYAIVSRTVRFPVGAGYVLPSYLVLGPMLLLLPPLFVPLLVATGLVLGTLARWAARRANAQELLFSIPDAWHAFGPAIVLALAPVAHDADRAGVYVAAFLAGCIFDLASSTVRESLISGIAPRLQLRVVLVAYLVDACVAPVGLFVGHAAEHDLAALLLLVPLNGLLIFADRDRTARIAQAHERLALVAHQRSRLQSAVHRLGEAFAAKLELRALADVLLHGSIDALDACAGHLTLSARPTPPINTSVGGPELEQLLGLASGDAQTSGQTRQLHGDGGWALAVPVHVGSEGSGTLAVGRSDRAFSADEEQLMLGLVDRAETAAAEIIAHELLHDQARTDPLTGLGNRRKLAETLADKLLTASADAPVLLMLFDLNGFKAYNDTFGHPAGDTLLARLGHKLHTAVSPDGSAYRLGGDEFCALLPANDDLERAIAAAAHALQEHGKTFEITASYGSVLVPHEAATADYALQVADKRMYGHKHGRRSGAGEQAHDVLIQIMRTKHHEHPDHASSVARLSVRVGRRLGIDGEQLDVLTRAADLHDIGKVGIPDAILAKPGPLDADEWDYIRQHTLLGERILSASPALLPVAAIVRSTHERWDGSGYPDRLRAAEIPLAARVIAACEAYGAMITNRPYRPARTPAVALEEMRRHSGRQFDPDVVTALLEELALAAAPSSCADMSSSREPTAAQTQRITEIVDHVRQQMSAVVGETGSAPDPSPSRDGS